MIRITAVAVTLTLMIMPAIAQVKGKSETAPGRGHAETAPGLVKPEDGNAKGVAPGRTGAPPPGAAQRKQDVPRADPKQK